MPSPTTTVRRFSPITTTVIALALVLGLVLAACNKGTTGEGNAPEVSEETPEFDFTVDKVTDTPTQPGAALTVKATAEDQKVADHLAKQLSLFYKSAFLDPANWKDGTYESAFELFDQGATPDAKANVEVLTAGKSAGTTYSDIQPGFSHFNVRVLTGEKGRILTASALVEFRALATLTAGGDRTLISKGTYFLNNVEGGWFINGFDIDREDADGNASEGETAPKQGDEKPKDTKDKNTDEEAAA
ncbi:MAG: hypothetical protein WD004_03080 [Actinomycetota bacterium]